MAIGSLAIAKFAITRGRIEELTIGKLLVDTLQGLFLFSAHFGLLVTCGKVLVME